MEKGSPETNHSSDQDAIIIPFGTKTDRDMAAFEDLIDIPLAASNDDEWVIHRWASMLTHPNIEVRNEAPGMLEIAVHRKYVPHWLAELLVENYSSDSTVL